MTFFAKIKQRFIERMEKENSRQREEEIKNSTAWHSRAYHRFYEGWSESYALDKRTGKRKIVRVYTGRYYVPRLSHSARLLVKLLYIALFIAAGVLFFSASMSGWSGNLVWYVTLPHAFCFGSLAYMFIVLISYIPAPFKMNIYEYKTSARSMRRASLIGAASHILSLLTALVYALIHECVDSAVGIMVKYLCAAAAFFAAFLTERSIEYDEEDNPASHDDNGTQIQ